MKLINRFYITAIKTSKDTRLYTYRGNLSLVLWGLTGVVNFLFLFPVLWRKATPTVTQIVNAQVALPYLSDVQTSSLYCETTGKTWLIILPLHYIMEMSVYCIYVSVNFLKMVYCHTSSSLWHTVLFRIWFHLVLLCICVENQCRVSLTKILLIYYLLFFSFNVYCCICTVYL